MEWNQFLTYDPDSPTFLINKITRSPKARKGEPAGCVSKKEIKLNYGGKFYRHSRIIWELHHGPIPEGRYIKFIDGNSFNLRIENLTLQSARERGVNGHQKVGESGERGVFFSGRSWIASAKVKGRTVYLGSYKTKEAAVTARRSALRLVRDL